MSDDYITSCELHINNQTIDDFSEVEEEEIVLAKTVDKMSGQGFGEVPPKYAVNVVYLVPSTGTEFDFRSVKNATLTIKDSGGRKTIYHGVRRLSIGAAKRDGKTEMTRLIKFGATRRVPA